MSDGVVGCGCVCGCLALVEGCEVNERLHGLDALRGLAVLLMFVDHVLIAFDEHHQFELVRMSLTRVCLPLFCVVAGSLIGSGPRLSRLAVVGAAGVVASWLSVPIGIGQPDILLLLVVAISLCAWAGSGSALRGWVVFALAILQPSTWAFTWEGYQPGVVVALVMLGGVIGPCRLDDYGCALQWRPVLSFVGRWPLSFYLGHLAVLAAAAWLL